MPKNHLDRKRYKLEELKIWVDGQMKRNHMTQGDLGKVLGLSQPSIHQMLKVRDKKKKNEKVREDPFSYGQVLTLCEYFGVDEKEKSRLLTM